MAIHYKEKIGREEVLKSLSKTRCTWKIKKRRNKILSEYNGDSIAEDQTQKRQTKGEAESQIRWKSSSLFSCQLCGMKFYTISAAQVKMSL